MSGKLNIEFDILDTKNPYFMSIVDQSNWALLQNNTSTLETILPGYEKAVVNYFDKNSINTLNAFNLGIICTDECNYCDYEALPDGVYCFTVKSSCGTYQSTKKFLRTTLIELDLDKVIIDRIKSCDTDNFVPESKITKAEFLLKAAKANLRYDNINEAGQLFTCAVELIDELTRKCK